MSNRDITPGKAEAEAALEELSEKANNIPRLLKKYGITDEEADRVLEQVREELFAERYPELAARAGESVAVMNLLLDFNVVFDGLKSSWGLSRAVLSLCAGGVHRMWTTQHIINEVERALLQMASNMPSTDADKLLDDYSLFMEKSRPRFLPEPTGEESNATWSLVRDVKDLPIMAAAINAKPDQLLSRNKKHFDAARIAAQTNIRDADPFNFFDYIHNGIL